jgi:hypothetical protein
MSSRNSNGMRKVLKLLAVGALPGGFITAGSAPALATIKPTKITPAVTKTKNCGANVNPTTVTVTGNLVGAVIQSLNGPNGGDHVQVRIGSSANGVNNFLWARVDSSVARPGVGTKIYNDWTKSGSENTQYNVCSHTVGTSHVNYTHAHRARSAGDLSNRACTSVNGFSSRTCTKWFVWGQL